MKKTKKLYCPNCMNEQNIECDFEYDEYSGIYIDTPHCSKCKENLLELRNEFLKDYQVVNYSEIQDAEQKYNRIEKMKKRLKDEYGEEKTNEITRIFSDNQNNFEYKYQINKTTSWPLIVFGMPAMCFLIVCFFSRNILLISLAILSSLFGMLVCATMSVRAKLYLELYNYILNNGKKYPGKVIQTYKIEEIPHNDDTGMKYLYYFFEVEYFNPIKNEHIQFFTPELLHAPVATKNITCDVYTVEEISNKLKNNRAFKKLKVKPHEIAINFNTNV